MAVFTLTLNSPVKALELMLKVAVIPVALDTTLLIVMPGIGIIDAPARFSPLIETGSIPPCRPLFGVMEVSNGPDPVTVKVTALVGTDPTDTMTFREPTAA